MKVIVTGGAGFIGSAVCRHLVAARGASVVNIDKLTYASNLASLNAIAQSERYAFHRLDICDREGVDAVIARERPDAIIHLAAETPCRPLDRRPQRLHHDERRRHLQPAGRRAQLLGAACRAQRKERFRFLHVSTDEVYGSLGADGLFTETTPYDPSSPYSASKAASDHLAMAWHRTYGLPVRHVELLQQLRALPFSREADPADDHQRAAGPAAAGLRQRAERARLALRRRSRARAAWRSSSAARRAKATTSAARSERSNIDVVHAICDLLDALAPARRRRLAPRR